MRNYFQIAQADPGNMQLNLAPINNALSGIRQNQYQNALMERRDAETAYQQGRDQKQDARQAESDKWARAERAGKIADAVEQLQGPQRQAAWQWVLTQFGSDDMTPEERDPMTGPALLRAQAGMYRDPRAAEMADLDVKYKQAQIGKLQAEARDAGTTQTRVGLQPIYGRDEQGNIVILQPSASGEMVQARPPQGVTIDPGLASGIKAQATASGKATGEAAAGLSKIEGQAQTALDTIEKLRTHEGRSEATGWGSLLPDVAFTNRAGRGFIDLYNQAQGGAFLQAFESLKGGGHITEIEGRKATEAISRINRAQRPEDFDQGLNDLRGIIERGVANARAKAQGGYSAPQAAPAAQPAIPPQAAQMLAADPSPEAIREFEEVFGAGAAQRVLNGR